MTTFNRTEGDKPYIGPTAEYEIENLIAYHQYHAKIALGAGKIANVKKHLAYSAHYVKVKEALYKQTHTHGNRDHFRN